MHIGLTALKWANLGRTDRIIVVLTEAYVRVSGGHRVTETEVRETEGGLESLHCWLKDARRGFLYVPVCWESAALQNKM